jgi:hypothetical protein
MTLMALWAAGMLLMAIGLAGERSEVIAPVLMTSGAALVLILSMQAVIGLASASA